MVREAGHANGGGDAQLQSLFGSETLDPEGFHQPLGRLGGALRASLW
jgi:hypothetical protein